MSMKKHWSRVDTKHLLLSVPSEVNLFKKFNKWLLPGILKIQCSYSTFQSPIHILITTDVSEDLSYSSCLCIEQKCLPDFFHMEYFPTANLESELKLMKMR